MKQKTHVLYIGKTHKRALPFVATTANSANMGGKTKFKVTFDQKTPSQLRYDATRFRHFASRLEILAFDKEFARKKKV